MSGHWKPGLYSNSYSNADEYRRKTAVRGEQRNEERSALRTLANAGGQAQAYPVCATILTSTQFSRVTIFHISLTLWYHYIKKISMLADE